MDAALLSYFNKRALADSSSSSAAEATEFTSIEHSVLERASNILSLNPATVDAKKSMVAIILVGSLAAVIIFIALYLLRWDHFDHHRAIDIAKKDREVDEYKEYQFTPATTKLGMIRDSITMNIAASLKSRRKSKIVKPFQFNKSGGLVGTEMSESNISQYIGEAIDSSLLNKDNPTWTFLKAFWKDHEYLNVFSESSMAETRFSRWLILCCSFLGK